MRYFYKICLAVYALHFIAVPAFAQGKYDFTWLLGTPNDTPNPIFGGDYICFDSGEIKINYVDLPIDLWYPNVVSDAGGQLSYYTNGCVINNKDHEILENGDDINVGDAFEIYCNNQPDPLGYPAYQGQLSLPLPGHEGEYIFLHIRQDVYLNFLELLHTGINMNANGGKGRVVYKNEPILQDTFSPSIVATRHANGRDWWVVLSRLNSSTYYVWLLDPEGLHGPVVQQPDSSWIDGQVITLNCGFSPDGSKFFRVGSEAPADFRLYDFDRCAGTLFNSRTIHIPDTATYAPWGCFSPNSRYLYVQNYGERLYQYDTWASDISTSAILVGVYDGFLSIFHLPVSFNSMLLAPDNKIYMSAGNGVNYLHTIHQPDSAGLACDFRQHDVLLPAHFPFYLSNMPFFRLYNSTGSICDSLGIQPPIVALWRSQADTVPLGRIFTDISYANPVSWEWNFGDGAFSNLSSPKHIYPHPGHYLVCLKVCNALNNCDSLCKEIQLFNVGSGTEEWPENPNVYVWPNPASERLFWSVGGTVKVRLFNLLGQKAMETVRSDGSVDIHSVPVGWYALQLFTSDGSLLLTKQVLIQR